MHSGTTGSEASTGDEAFVPPADEFIPPAPWAVARQLVFGVVALFGTVVVLGAVLREPIEHYSKILVGQLGLGGVFAGVVLLDSTPFLTHEPIMFTAVFAGYPLVPLAAVIAGGSLCAAGVNWLGGRFLGDRIPPLKRMLKRYKIHSFIERYGALAIGGGAMLPMPFAMIGWGAGAAGAPLWTVMVGGVVRAVKVVVVLSFLHYGWSLGT